MPLLLRRLVTSLALLLAFTAPAVVGAAVDATRQWVPGQVLVKFHPGVDPQAKSALVRGKRVRSFADIGVEQWQVDGPTVEDAVRALEADPRVALAEPNYLLYSLDTPNDPSFGQLWGLDNTGQLDAGGTAGAPDADIDAPEAWSVSHGSQAVVVAIIDTGIDYTHPDLAANIWTNPGEIAGNGIDDDGNGYVDDIHGWDFVNRDGDPMDDNNHGSHCAGTIGGVGNNGVGVAGVNWNVRMMALKFLTGGGIGSTADAVACIQYATMMGVDVISNSWGGGGYDPVLEAAIQAAYAADIFFVAAAGNNGVDTDASANYPSCYAVPNVIAVLATNNRDQRANEPGWWASNYGATSVDIGAPGLHIYSSVAGGGYDTFSGTSMACPHVAGALALLRARFPGITVDEGRNRLLTVGFDPVPALSGLCATGGRLNLVKLIGDPDAVAPSAVADLGVADIASNHVGLAWTAPGDDGDAGKAMAYDVRYAAGPIATEEAWAAATQATGEPAPAPAGTPQTMSVGGLATSTTYHFAIRALDEFGNIAAPSNSPTATTLAAPTMAVEPASLWASLATGGTVTQVVTIANTGVGVLDYVIPAPTLVLPGRAVPAVAVHEYVELPKGAPDLAPGDPAPLGAGGPDRFGYRWIDGDQAGGPTYGFADISGVGTPVTLGDDTNLGPFDLGFTFPFYGNRYTSFRIASNGFITFTSTNLAATNSRLPATGAPRDMLALFWDDLMPNGGTTHYYFDGARMIVQYTNWGRYSGVGQYTMQAQIYPDGTIEYHYGPMSGNLASATIGIQDATGTDGLSVAYNAEYVHEGLAIRFRHLPRWLAADPAMGSVPAGGSVDVGLTFDAIGLCDGRLEATVNVTGNDPLLPEVSIPVAMDVTGAPDIAAKPDSLAFPATYTTATATLPLEIRNAGCVDLTVTGLEADDSAFGTGESFPFVIAPGASHSLPVRFTPGTAGPHAGRVGIASDDQDHPIVAVAVTGLGRDIPDIAVVPAALEATLPGSGTTTQHFAVTNNGPGELEFTIPAVTYVPATAAAPVVTPMGGGGPDAYAYKWLDSDAPGGPAYNWIEIAGLGTEIPFSLFEQNLGPWDLPFPFPFYGTEFTSFRASTDGWISFTSADASTSVNMELPNANAPENLIAPFWDDMAFISSGSAWYYDDGTRLIVEYADVPRYAPGGPYTFQVHLYRDGTIEFHYKSMQGTRLNEATVGIQNGARDTGLTTVFDAPYVHDGLAVRFFLNTPWLTVTPNAGIVPPGGSVDVTVGFDARGLCRDAYTADLHVLSNDQDTPDLAIPVTMRLEGTPDALASPGGLAFGEVYLGYAPTLAAVVANNGCTPLEVGAITIDDPAFTTTLGVPFTVDAGATLAVPVTFRPGAPGAFAGTLVMPTNDPTHPELVITLAGTGVDPPGLRVLPGALAATLLPGRQQSSTLALSNSSDQPIDFTVPSPDIYTRAVAGAADPVTAIDTQKDAPEIMGVASPNGYGGPDLYGYVWRDSDAADGPTYAWVDIAATGTALLTTGDDVATGPIPIGFPFTYYGNTYSTFRVCSNGWLSFSSLSTNFSNSPLPSTYAPVNLLAPFWDDLDLRPAAAGDVLYQNVSGNLVVQWNNIMRIGMTVPMTFEAIIAPDGSILFQYKAVAGSLLTSATVGIQDATGKVGLQVVCNAPYLHNDLAIRFSTLPQWATVAPMTGSVPAHGSVDLAVTCDATGLYLGHHTGRLYVLSNDVAYPSIPVELSLEVVDHLADAGLPVPGALALAQNAPNPFNPATRIVFVLPVAGPVDLRVYDVRGAVVRTLAIGTWPAGEHAVTWNGLTDGGGHAPSGVYFCRLGTGSGEITRTMTLVR